MRAEWPQSQLRWIAHRQEALWNKSLWLRMCRKLKWQLTGCNSSTSFVAMCAISCIKSSSLQALVTLVPASRWIVYGVHGLSGVHAPNVVTRSDLSRAAIIAICGRRLDESSFTCFRYFWNLCLFVFCLMKLFSILALVRRIATTLLANLANPSYRVQPSRHWQNTCSTSFTSSPLCYFYVDMQIVNMVHIHYNTLNDGERERERAGGDFEQLKISISPYAQNFEAFPPTWHFEVAQPLWKDAGGPMFEVDDKDVYN